MPQRSGKDSKSGSLARTEAHAFVRSLRGASMLCVDAFCTVLWPSDILRTEGKSVLVSLCLFVKVGTDVIDDFEPEYLGIMSSQCTFMPPKSWEELFTVQILGQLLCARQSVLCNQLLLIPTSKTCLRGDL